MKWLIRKLIDMILGRLIEYINLIHEAYRLSDKEKEVIKKYDKTHELAKSEFSNITDNLIKKSIAAMCTNNRVLFTEKGEKLKKIIRLYKF